MVRKNILIMNPRQFGYQAGYFYYCKYLRDEYNIFFLCFDQHLPKMELENVHVKYVPFTGNKIQRKVRWFWFLIKEIRAMEKNCMFFMVYFKACFLIIFLFPYKKIILDIRTGSISKSDIKNYFQNLQFKTETFFFRRITILSEGLIGIIGINPEKCHLLPLGADIISDKNKTFEDLKLLYVGTFSGRRIHETIEGLKLFIEKYKEAKHRITYNIFGSGTREAEDLLLMSIKENSLEKIVHLHGRKNHQELKVFFDKSNIGVSYVPITKYYNFQPPTKTFEYILSGIPCIATSTLENKKLINSENGVICEDNPESFAKALENIYLKGDLFDSEKVRATLISNSWENVVNSNFKKYLATID